MKFDPIHCPSCGQLATGTYDMVPGCAQFGELDENGEIDYGGYTKLWWNDQRTQKDDEGRILLWCANCDLAFPAVEIKEAETSTAHP